MKCPYCLCGRANHFCQKEERTYVECRQCESLYIQPRPTEEEMLAVSPGATANEQCHPDNSGYMRLKPEWRERYEREMFLTWRELGMPARVRVVPRKVLDVGCANGQLLDWLARAQWETHGIDITETHAGTTSKDHEIQIGDLRDGRCAGMGFGLVTAIDIIEHLVDPRAMLEAIHDSLAPGGLFLLQGPRVGRISKAYGKEWRQLWAPYHCSLHTEGGIRKALHDTGFRVEQYISWGAGMGDTGQVPDRHRLAWNQISKELNMGDEIALVATTPV
jgi:SAM-dependent methyltransferase